MSASGLLTEDEIKSYIQESFKINIDISSLIKPTREFVEEIYSRFLDGFELNWRENGINNELPAEARMVKSIIELTSNFNLAYTFTLTDLIYPTRKKTNAFLNVLIYIRAQVEEKVTEYEEYARERALCIEEMDKMRLEKAKKVSECEILAAEIGRSKSNNEIKSLIETRQKELEELNKENESILTEAREYKKKFEALDNEISILEGNIAQIEEENSSMEEKLNLLNNGKVIEKNILDLKARNKCLIAELDKYTKDVETSEREDRTFKRFLDVLRINATDLSCDLEKQETSILKAKTLSNNLIKEIEESEAFLIHHKNQISERKDLITNKVRNNRKLLMKYNIQLEQEKQLSVSLKLEIQNYRSQIKSIKDSLQKDIDEIKKQTAEILSEEENYMNNCSTTLEKLDNKMQRLNKSIKQLKKGDQTALIANKFYQAKLDQFLGRRRDEIELPADRTYIKESKK